MPSRASRSASDEGSGSGVAAGRPGCPQTRAVGVPSSVRPLYSVTLPRTTTASPGASAGRPVPNTKMPSEVAEFWSPASWTKTPPKPPSCRSPTTVPATGTVDPATGLAGAGTRPQAGGPGRPGGGAGGAGPLPRADGHGGGVAGERAGVGAAAGRRRRPAAVLRGGGPRREVGLVVVGVRARAGHRRAVRRGRRRAAALV